MNKFTMAAASLLICAPLASGCGSDDGESSSQSAQNCPSEVVSIVVSVDQWGDIVEQLGGECADVTTIVEGSSADPHDYEPSPGDMARFEGTDLVVMNGAGYDEWAAKATDTLDPKPAVIDGGEVVGLADGDNPHIWYGPTYVHEVAAATTAELKTIAPTSAAYFDQQLANWERAMSEYDAKVIAVTATAKGRTFAASEPVFDFMAEAVGLEQATPEGYQDAAANETDPSPGDVAEFERSLSNGSVDVFIHNTQTEGPIPDQLRREAESGSVPVVEVTETMPPGTDSFVEWQVSQLTALANALTT